MRLLILSLFLVTLTGCQQSSDITTNQQVSYAFGYTVADTAKSFNNNGLAFDKTSFIKGLNDSLAKKPHRLSEEQRAELQKNVTEIASKHQKKTSISSLKVAEDFLELNSKRDGVLTLESGVQYRVLTKGTGALVKDNTIEFKMIGTLIDGTVFDQTTNTPYKFSASQLVPGLSSTLPLMKVGDKWEIVIPPHLAYGEQGAGDVIAPNSLLIFTIEVVSIVKDEDSATKK